MDGLQWKTQLKWMIKRYPHFRKPPCIDGFYQAASFAVEAGASTGSQICTSQAATCSRTFSSKLNGGVGGFKMSQTPQKLEIDRHPQQSGQGKYVFTHQNPNHPHHRMPQIRG